MDLKHLFLQEATLTEHFDAQTQHYSHYTSLLLLLLSQNIELSHGTRSRVLAAFWARRDYELAEHILAQPQWGLPDMIKALRFLDSERRCRAYEKRLARLEAQGSATAATLGQLRSKIKALQDEPGVGSLSGALAKRVRRWVRSLTAERLEEYVLSMPHEPWQELADMVHLRQEDFQLDWFLPVIYGAAPLENTMLSDCLGWVNTYGKGTKEANTKAATETLQAIVETWQVPYSFIRMHVTLEEQESKQALARYESLDTLLWYYEELSCPAVAKLIQSRLEEGETPTFGYGKLVERLLAFERMEVPFQQALIDAATKRLSALKLPLEAPVVVLGDASSSMDAAIRVATILGSLLTAITGAELHFFNGSHFPAPTMPRDVDGVLEVVKHVRASGCTSPAAALAPFYENNQLVRHFIVVTDEEENTSAKAKGRSLMFADIMHRYREEVYPAKVAFVSFLRNPQQTGQMVKALEAREIPCLQFRLSQARPDLTKTDALLGLLASESAFFSERADSLASAVDQGGWKQALWALTDDQDGGQVATLYHQIQALRDIAFATKSDHQTLLARLSRLHHLAKDTAQHSIAEDAKALMHTLASQPQTQGHTLPEGLRHQIIAQSEIWELGL